MSRTERQQTPNLRGLSRKKPLRSGSYHNSKYRHPSLSLSTSTIDLRIRIPQPRPASRRNRPIRHLIRIEQLDTAIVLSRQLVEHRLGGLDRGEAEARHAGNAQQGDDKQWPRAQWAEMQAAPRDEELLCQAGGADDDGAAG